MHYANCFVLMPGDHLGDRPECCADSSPLRIDGPLLTLGLPNSNTCNLHFCCEGYSFPQSAKSCQFVNDSLGTS